MHYVTDVEYDSEYRLYLRFEEGNWRIANLKQYLTGEVFSPLRDTGLFQTARLNSDIDTVVWDNGADMSPDFLYEISVPTEDDPQLKAAEASGSYKTRTGL